MDDQVFEAAGSAPAAEVVGNPFMALMEPPIGRIPSSTGITVVRNGKTLRSGQRRQIQKTGADQQLAADPDEDAGLGAQERLAMRERQLAYYRARYQRRKADPVEQARRRESAKRNKEKRQAYQRAWREKNLEKSRAYHAAWQRRKLKGAPDHAEAHRAALRAYYAANREQILAKAKARREERKDAYNAQRRAYRAANAELVKGQQVAYRERKKARELAKTGGGA